MFVYHSALNCHSQVKLNYWHLFIRSDCAGAADKGRGQKLEPAGTQTNISNPREYSYQAGKKKKGQKAELWDTELLH